MCSGRVKPWSNNNACLNPYKLTGHETSIPGGERAGTCKAYQVHAIWLLNFAQNYLDRLEMDSDNTGHFKLCPGKVNLIGYSIKRGPPWVIKIS